MSEAIPAVVEAIPAVVAPVVMEKSNSSLSLTARDVLFIGIGFGAGFAFKHYRNVYLEWKRKKLERGLSSLILSNFNLV